MPPATVPVQKAATGEMYFPGHLMQPHSAGIDGADVLSVWVLTTCLSVLRLLSGGIPSRAENEEMLKLESF